MSRTLPETLDPIRQAELGSCYSGEWPLAAMHRLRSLLLSDQGQVSYELHFHRTPLGRSLVTGRVSGGLAVRCQRCLEPLVMAVDQRLNLAVVQGLDEAEALDEAYDPLLIEQQGQRIRPADLLEEELLLALPQVPRHRDGDCLEPAGRASGPKMDRDPVLPNRESPFAGLAEWHSKSKQS